MKIRKTCFCVFAFFIAMVMLFNFIGLKTAPVVWAVTTDADPEPTDIEDISINNLIDNADISSNEDGYDFNVNGYLNMEEDRENNIDGGTYYISINATYSASDNYLHVEIMLITPAGEVIVQSGAVSVLSNTAMEYYNDMPEDEKESIRDSANTDANEGRDEYEEFVEQGGISVDDLAIVLDVAIAILSLVLTLASFTVVTWQAMQITNGLTRNILSKVAMKALKSFLASNTLVRFLGDSLMAILNSCFDIVCTATNVTIGRLIAVAIDNIDGNENGRCFG